MARILDFFDGFSSNTQPLLQLIAAGKLVVFANDAAYVSSKGSPAEEGDIYWNSTDKVIRVFDGTNWTSIQANFSIANESTKDSTITGLVNSSNVNFALSQSPISADHLLISVNGVRFTQDEYSLITNTITFNVAPETGSSVEAFYFYDGSLPIITPPTGILVSEDPITITPTNITNKWAKIPSSPDVPLEPTKVSVFYLGVGKIINGEDFQIIGDEIHWNGLGLDTFPIASGDRLDFRYYK